MSSAMSAFLIFAVVTVALTLFIVAVSLSKQRRQREQTRRALSREIIPHYQKDQLLSISIKLPSALTFFIQPESNRTRTMRAQGALVEQQTGAPAFDEQVYIECDDPALGAWLRTDEEARRLIRTLLAGDRTLELRKENLSLALKGETDNFRIGKLGEALSAFAGRVPRIGQAHPAVTATAHQVLLMRMLCALVIVLAVGFWLQLMLESEDPFPQHGSMLAVLIVGGLLGAAAGGLAYMRCMSRLRHSSRAPRMAAELLVMLCLPLVVLGVFAARYFNLHTVRGPEQQALVQLERTYSQRHRRSTSHHLALGPIADAQLPAQSYDSSARLNTLLKGETTVRVYWRRGLFGSVILTRNPEPARPTANVPGG